MRYQFQVDTPGLLEFVGLRGPQSGTELENLVSIGPAPGLVHLLEHRERTLASVGSKSSEDLLWLPLIEFLDKRIT